MRAKAGEIRFLYGGATKAKNFLKKRTKMEITWIDEKDAKKQEKENREQLKKIEDILSEAGIEYIE